MKKYVAASFLGALLIIAGASFAQDTKDKDKKDKEKMGEYDEIIIKKKGDKDGKITIEIKDGEIKVNGKGIDEYDDDNISVRQRKTPRVLTTTGYRFRNTAPPTGSGDSWSYSGNDPGMIFSNGTKAFLGVTTDDVEEGAKIISVSDNSGAEKAGLKKGDIITKIGDHTIEDAGDLTEAIGKYKPEDKVTITYKRDGKENKVTATLGKNKASGYAQAYGFAPDAREFPSDAFAPLERLNDYNFNWDRDKNNLLGTITGRPRLGIKAQDTEEGNGVKVLNVAPESSAGKAGIKEGDIITEFDGNKITSADELAEAAQESREKTSVKLQVIREGKTQTIEIKTPKKLKTANL